MMSPSDRSSLGCYGAFGGGGGLGAGIGIRFTMSKIYILDIKKYKLIVMQEVAALNPRRTLVNDCQLSGWMFLYVFH